MTTQQNLVSHELAPETVAQMIEQANKMRTDLPFLIGLGSEDRVSLPKPGDRAFEACLSIASMVEQHAAVFPRELVDAAEIRRDVALAKALVPLATVLRGLTEAVEDTILAARSDAYRASLDGYALAKVVGKTVPGLQSLVEPLRDVLDRRGRSRKPQQPE